MIVDEMNSSSLQLVDDALAMVFIHLNPRDLLSSSCVCRQWNTVASTDDVFCFDVRFVSLLNSRYGEDTLLGIRLKGEWKPTERSILPYLRSCH